MLLLEATVSSWWLYDAATRRECGKGEREETAGVAGRECGEGEREESAGVVVVQRG
jgi:hypothetical protein